MIILSPGPLTTSEATKAAMLRDFSPNEPELLALTRGCAEGWSRSRTAAQDYTCVMLQGAGNTANGGARDAGGARSRVLVGQQRPLWPAPSRDRPGDRRAVHGARAADHRAVRPDQVDAALAGDAAISHVAVCHVDTGTGLLDPIEPVAEVARRRGVGLIVDAIASFGGLPIDAGGSAQRRSCSRPTSGWRACPAWRWCWCGAQHSRRRPDAATPSASTCTAVAEPRGRTAGWRFTPPAQAIAALAEALCQHARGGFKGAICAGCRGTGARWCTATSLLGFETVLRDDEVAAPGDRDVLRACRSAASTRARLFELMRRARLRDLSRQPDAVPYAAAWAGIGVDSISAAMREVVPAVEASLAQMGVTDCRPAAQSEAAE